MPISDNPALIVNADDLGWNPPTTDAILETYRERRITSATAMVYMEDSARAAKLASEAGLPVGLHVNLTDPFSASYVPDSVRERQMTAIRHFGAPGFVRRSKRWIYDPRVASLTSAAVADQLKEFRNIFECEPTHFDGHNHVHVCPNVALALPPSVKVRTALGCFPNTTGPMARLAQLRRMFTLDGRLTTRYFLSITDLHPEFVPGGPASILGSADHTSVEVMAHPGFGHEYTMLMASDWSDSLAGLRCGSYRDLGV